MGRFVFWQFFCWLVCQQCTSGHPTANAGCASSIRFGRWLWRLYSHLGWEPLISRRLIALKCTEVEGILLEPIAGEKKMLNYSDCRRDLLDSSGWFLPPEWGTDGLYKGLILGMNVCFTCWNGVKIRQHQLAWTLATLVFHPIFVSLCSASDLASLAWSASKHSMIGAFSKEAKWKSHSCPHHGFSLQC